MQSSALIKKVPYDKDSLYTPFLSGSCLSNQDIWDCFSIGLCISVGTYRDLMLVSHKPHSPDAQFRLGLAAGDESFTAWNPPSVFSQSWSHTSDKDNAYHLLLLNRPNILSANPYALASRFDIASKVGGTNIVKRTTKTMLAEWSNYER